MRTIMRKLGERFFLPALLLFSSSCELFEYNPFDTFNFDETGINQTNIIRIEDQKTASDTLRFVFIGDTQRHYDETEDFVAALNQRDDIDFVIHGGDVTDFGLSKEYMWMNDILKKLHVPYVAVIGNHDIVGHGKDVFKEFYGDFNFSFISKQTRFICLNTNALEFDYSTPVPDFEYMQSFIDDTVGVKQTIVIMHAPPYDIQFNNNSAFLFNFIIEQYQNVIFCLHAHQHSLKENDFFENNIMYYGCDDIEGRNYMLFTVTSNSYDYRVEYF